MTRTLQQDESLDTEAWIALEPACIICLGNELACDDGVGVRMGRILQSLPLPTHVVVRLCPQIDLDLIDHLLTAQRFILCDATRMGLEPGTVTVDDWQFAASLSRQPYCCHGIGLSDLLSIAAELDPDHARWEVHLVGVEAQTIDEFGTRLSDSVEASLPRAISEVLKKLAAPVQLLPFAEAAAKCTRAPSVLDAAITGT
jgi:hydrogenase maturation protease